MERFRSTTFLIFILIVSFLLRFVFLARFPVSLSIDEVIIGYDSYSLLKTGRDHWGEFLPLAFRSIGDYKPPVLVYLMIPAVAIFGLNEFGIRFTVALIGSISPLIAYLLAKKLIGNKNIGLLTAFLLAISPWHINFSRSTFEAILALFFLMSGVYLFLWGVENKGKRWWLSGILLSLSIYSYHAERVFTPLLILVIFFLFKKKIFRYKKEALRAVLISFVFLLPFIFIMLSPKGQTRARISIFLNDYELSTRWKEAEKDQLHNFWGKIGNNYFVYASSFWAKRYLEYSDLDYLFFKGMRYTHDKFPDVGLMFIWELPFFLLGLFVLVNKSLLKDKSKRRLFWAWLLLGPLPASLANNSQHPLRSLTTIPIPQIISATGIWFFWKWFKKQVTCLRLRRICFFAFATAVVVNLAYYLDIYYVHYPVHYSHYLMYGMKEASLYAWKHRKEYDQVIFDPQFGVEDKNITSIPFAYVLTYGKVDPVIIQKARESGVSPLAFENFVFRSVNWAEDRKLKNALLIASFWSFPLKQIPSQQIVKVIPLYNGMPMFYLVKTNGGMELRD